MISLRPITDDNRDAVLALSVSPTQRQFVSTVPDSLAEADEYPGAHAIYWAVYDDETPVGFVMIADEVDDHPEYIPQFLWKLLIDKEHQGKGYGTAVLDLVVAYFKARPGVEVVTTSAGQGPGSPIPFYEKYGFVRTGEMHGSEVELKLDIT